MHLIKKPETEFTGQVWPMPACSVMKGIYQVSESGARDEI